MQKHQVLVTISLLATLLFAGCSQQSSPELPSLQPTVDAQQREIAALETQLLELTEQLAVARTQLHQVGIDPNSVTGAAAAAPEAESPTMSPLDSPVGTAAPAAEPVGAAPLPLEPAPALPTPTPFPPFEAGPLLGDPPAGLVEPQGTYATRWREDLSLQESLGWAVDDAPRAVDMVAQRFERGTMFWRSDNSTITILLADGSWVRYPDTFAEGEPESDPTLFPQNNLIQPVRGFGKLWRSQSGVRDQLGWATEKEQIYNGTLQEFARGEVVQVGINTFVLAHQPDGSPVWSR